MRFFIKDDYYFDIDVNNQLRISGPGNHLFLGVSFPHEVPLEIAEYGMKKGKLWIRLQIQAESIAIPTPIVTDIRTLRNHTEQMYPRPTYAELLQKNVIELTPKTARWVKRGEEKFFEFSNHFREENGLKRTYGTLMCAENGAEIQVEGTSLKLVGSSPLTLYIETISNIRVKDKIRKKIFNSHYLLPRELFSEQLFSIYDRSEEFITHLVRARKTSSFEYGTIFPRDWIESADLGVGDLTQATVDYMYGQSLMHVNDEGEAWHEDAIGQHQARIRNSEEIVDRKMIDIEPRFLLGMRNVSKAFLTSQTTQEKLRRIAKFVLKNATERELISFKKISGSEEYHIVGNWRDSAKAFPAQQSPVSPYDVNCVFYPMALRVIREFSQFFEIDDLSDLNELIEKWDAQKHKFRLYHTQSLVGYSLALHGKRNVPIPVAHLDESYDLFYGIPSLGEIVSFAQKAIDPNFFYTPVGPLLVDIDDNHFTTQEYHGKVIWPKQAAFAVAGLSRQYRRGIKEGWPWPVIEQIKAAVIATSEACFAGWEQLGSVPELYYYDHEQKRARFYTDQDDYEGQMSHIQLWSSVGCRRIMQDYAAVKKISEAI
jgi:hypothetical protein